MSRLLQGSHASRLAFACLSGLLGCVAPVASGGLWWRLGWSPPASVGLLVVCFRGCWSPGCSPGCKVRGVMDRGGLDGLSFERGGRSADYVPASASFCWSLSASASVLVGSSLGLRGGRADSLLCFELVTLRVRRAGLRLLASLCIGCVVRIGDSFELASMCWAVFAALQSAHGLRLLLSSGCSLSSFARLLRSARLLGCALLGLAPWLASLGWPRLLRSPRLAGSAGVSLALLSTVRRG